MADRTRIEWADASWNPLAGCALVSPGCTNCYAMRVADRLHWIARSSAKYRGLTQGSKAGPVWTGRVRFDPEALDQPQRWRRPRRVFVGAMSDLFYGGVEPAWREQIFAAMAAAPQHLYLVLTKRPRRMLDFAEQAANRGAGALPPRIGWGVSVEDQPRAEDRLSLLRRLPGAGPKEGAPGAPGAGPKEGAPGAPGSVLRWVSAEPLLGPLLLGTWLPELGWVVAGGETGTGARPAHPDWLRSLRDQCAAHGVPFFFKHWGEWAPAPEAMDYTAAEEWAREHYPGRPFAQHSSGHTLVRVGRRNAGRLLDAVEHNAYPTII